jgi:hypothetical protein
MRYCEDSSSQLIAGFQYDYSDFWAAGIRCRLSLLSCCTSSRQGHGICGGQVLWVPALQKGGAAEST